MNEIVLKAILNAPGGRLGRPIGPATSMCRRDLNNAVLFFPGIPCRKCPYEHQTARGNFGQSHPRRQDDPRDKFRQHFHIIASSFPFRGTRGNSSDDHFTKRSITCRLFGP
jgi:hypothetical protein